MSKGFFFKLVLCTGLFILGVLYMYAHVGNAPLLQLHMSDRAGRCSERRNIFFLRVPKTGSTTIRHLFLRFGIERNLSFMLFASNRIILQNFRQLLLPEPNRSTGFTGRYNIVCDHIIYNDSEIKALMPKDTFYLASLRHPIAHI